MTVENSDDSSNKPWDVQVTSDDDDGGTDVGEVGGSVDDSWSQILDKLGVDTQAMSLTEIQSIIQQYEQEGLKKGAKVIDIKTGESVQKYKQDSKKKSGRTITVKAGDGEPLTQSEMEKEIADQDYKGSKGKDKASTPDSTPFIKPKGPGGI